MRLDPGQWESFFSELVHVVRNAIDHGIESPEERRALGKPSVATLTFRARSTSSSIEFEMGDDGRGIAWDDIAKKARARGMRAETASDLVEALWSAGVSTKDEATEISGRGIGLHAVKACVEAMEGDMRVQSSTGAGTFWTFCFPQSSTIVLRTSAEMPAASPVAKRPQVA